MKNDHPLGVVGIVLLIIAAFAVMAVLRSSKGPSAGSGAVPAHSKHRLFHE